jgi:hypothetical protein
MIESINEKLDEHAVTHQKILDQVTYTNGKVRKLYLLLTIIGTAVATLFLKDPNSALSFLIPFI